MAPNYKFVQMFGNSDAVGNVVHPWIIKTSTNFYNDPSNGQIFPQATSVNNTKKNTTLIDSYLTVGGVCAGKMGVLKIEDTDGSIGNSNGILLNNPGGLFGAAINSVVAGAQDGLMPGTPISPNALGLGAATDVFDQGTGTTFSVVNGAVAALGGAVGTTTSNMILIGQFTTDGVLSFSFNVQLSNTVTNTSEIYVPSAPNASETAFPTLAWTSATTNTTSTVSIADIKKDEVRIQLVPNPTEENCQLNISQIGDAQILKWTVRNLIGGIELERTIIASSNKVSEEISTSTLSKGMYIIEVEGKGWRHSEKLIKR
jgi:hypothetical protein